jgi:hypothetical protein
MQWFYNKSILSFLHFSSSSLRTYRGGGKTTATQIAAATTGTSSCCQLMCPGKVTSSGLPSYKMPTSDIELESDFRNI